MTTAKKQLHVIHTSCGPVSANCSTCARSTFVKADRHRCDVTRRQVSGDSSCQHWQPLFLGDSRCVFGLGHGQVPEC